ncbi:MAG: SPOR domain-containing protein [Planctomycetota bacterium]
MLTRTTAFTWLNFVPIFTLIILFVAGCDRDREEADVADASRPEVLSLATDEIKSGKSAAAQQRLEAFLRDNSKSSYRSHVEYLLGQAIAAQGNFEESKKHLDWAIDKTEDRTLKALAMLGRADCNLALQKWHLASRQYHWLETMYRDVKAIAQDELLFKLGMATKQAGFPETADYWFNQVIELYATSPFAEKAKQQNTKYNPIKPENQPLVYSLEVASYGNQKKAESEAKMLRDKEYRDVQVIATTRNGMPNYEIHIGKYGNKTDAIRAQTDAAMAGLNTTIRPALVEPLK